MTAHYAWTIRYPDRQDIQRVTTIPALEDVLRLLQLPGIVPTEFVTDQVATSRHGTYTHNHGGDDEWLLTWTHIHSV